MATDPNDEIPSFRFTDKRVDESWKEEMRREKAKPAAAPAPAPETQAPPAHAGEADAEVEAVAPGEAPVEGEGAAPAGLPKTTGTPAEQKEAKVFMTFLAGLAQQALMQLGQMPNPYTGQAELDVNGARYTIELLAVIQKKTKGNLSPEENQMLAGTIQDLKMAYGEIVAELNRQMAAQAKGAMKPGPGGAIPGPGFGRR